MKQSRRIEALEQRTLLAAVYWDGGGDGVKWSDEANWTNNQLPGQSDDVTIDVPGTPTINVDLSSLAYINSIVCHEKLDVNSMLFVWHGATLNGAVNVKGGFGALNVGDSITLNNVITYTNTSEEQDLTLFGESATLAGTGSINFAGAATNSYIIRNSTRNTSNVGGMLTIGADMEITTSRPLVFINEYAGANIVNNGSFSILGAEVSIGGLSRRVTNNGAISLSQASTLHLFNLTNGVTGTVTSNSSTLHLAGDAAQSAYNWDNDGAISVTNSTLRFDGYFKPANVGTLTRTNSQVFIDGTLDNTSNNLTFSAQTGVWELTSTGRIMNGIVDCIDGQTFIARGGTLEAVWLKGATRVYGGVNIERNLNLSGSLKLGDTTGVTGGLAFVGTLDQTLSGTGSIVSEGTSGTIANETYVQGQNIGRTLTIDSTMSITFNGRGNISSSYGWIVNNGDLNFNGVGSQQTSPSTLGARVRFTNNGSISVVNTPEMHTENLFNNASGDIVVSDCEFTFDETQYTTTIEYSWGNGGTVSFTNTYVLLDGEFFYDDLGNYTRINSEFGIAGTLNNVDQTFTLNDHTGSWNLHHDARVLGGTIESVGSNRLRPRGGTLDGVRLNTPLTIDTPIVNTNTALIITNGLELNSSITVALTVDTTSANIKFVGPPMSVTGNGSFDVVTNVQTLIYNQCQTGTLEPGLIIGSGITFNLNARASFTAYTGNTHIQFDGTLNAIGNPSGTNNSKIGTDSVLFTNNGTITISNSANVTVSGLINNGTVTISDSTLKLSGSIDDLSRSWDNNGLITISNSTLTLGGIFETADIGQISRSNITSLLSGIIDNTNATLSLDDTVGTLTALTNSRIKNGVVSSLSGASQLIVQSPIFEAVTLNAPVTVESNQTLSIERGLTLNNTMELGTAGGTVTLRFNNKTGAQTLSGIGIINASPNTIVRVANATLLGTSGHPGNVVTIEDTIEMNLGKNGQFYAPYADSNATIINKGVIRIVGDGVADSTFEIGLNGGLKFVNSGVVIASDGVRLNIRRLDGLARTITATGDKTRVLLAGIYTLSGLVTVADSAWLDVTGDWTFAGEMNISSTATFLKTPDNSNTFTTIRSAIMSGYAAGAWTGPGIRDIVAAANPSTTLGYARAANVTSNGFFNGIAVDPNAVIAHHTLDADFNLDNAVGFSDLLIAAQNYGQSDRSFSDGDSNFDGVVNFSDILRASQLYGQSLFANQREELNPNTRLLSEQNGSNVSSMDQHRKCRFGFNIHSWSEECFRQNETMKRFQTR